MIRKQMIKFVYILAPIICLMVYVQAVSTLSFFIGQQAYPIFQFMDPDNVFVVITVHHLCQAIITLFVVFILARKWNMNLQGFGFNFQHFKYGLKLVLIFMVIWAVIQTGCSVILIHFMGQSPAFNFPLTVHNFTGYFLFEIFLSGTSEEIMFRSLVITAMLYLWNNQIKNEKTKLTLVILASSVVFMVAHINFSIFPFQITYINLYQQLTALIFGVFYGYLFMKTKSVVGCMIAHNLLNAVIIIVQLAFNL